MTTARRLRLARFEGLLLAAAGAAVFALLSPPLDVYPAVLPGLALFAGSVERAPSTWRAFGRGAFWGTIDGIIGLRFVPIVVHRFTPLGVAAGILALVLLAAAQSIVWAIGAAVANVLRRRAHAPLEIAFPAGVLLATSLPTVFAWTPAGVLTPWPAFVQLADVVGERGVSALLALGGVLVWRTLERLAARAPMRTALRPLAIAAALVVAMGGYGALRMRAIARASAALPTVRVGLVDQSVGPLERWVSDNRGPILAKLRALTQASEGEGAELTIWPEAAYPFALAHGDRKTPRGARAIVGGGVRGPVLAGLITHDAPEMVEPGLLEQSSFNSATLVGPDGSMQPPQDKLELLWFGETVPFGRQLPWLRRMFQRSGGLVPGDEPRALVLPRDGSAPLRMGVLNCYEDTLPGVGRRIVNGIAPNLLVNVTNDAWFFGTPEPEFHARLAVMRAVELRRDLVRAVNMGVLSWVDARGVVRVRYDGGDATAVLATPALRDDGRTLYARFGDAPAFVLLGGLAALFAWRRRGAQRAPTVTPAAT